MDDNLRSKKSSRLNPKKQQKLEIPIQSSWKPATIHIAIQVQQRLAQVPKILSNQKIYLNEAGDIVASYLVEQLMSQRLVRQQNSLSFYDQKKDVFVYGFIVPKTAFELNETTIAHKFLANNTLRIKIRNKKKIVIDALIEEQRQKYEECIDQKNNKGQKQKKIGEVVEKVALWRKFYTGFYDDNGNYIQKPLQSAAQQVGIAKKTLDDYLLQIRNGKKYGFDFNQKYNCKIGELRAFVRDQKKKQIGGR